EQYQKEILEALAAGAAQLPYVVSAHREVCPVCREFCETEPRLFRSIDSGLRAMVDQAVPPSLIPGVRARLNEQPVTRRMWIPGWSFAVVVAVTILVASLGYLRREPGRNPNSQPGISVASRSTANSVPTMQSPRKPVAASHTRTKKSATSAVLSPAPAEPVPEVI